MVVFTYCCKLYLSYFLIGSANLTSPSHNIEAQITIALTFLGFVLGIFVSIGVLSGDSQGRVNVLFLLLLFAFLPAFSLLLSLLLLVFKQNGLAGIVVSLPIWPKEYSRFQVDIELSGQRRRWLFFQSQVLSLAFSVGGIIVFFILLLGTDVNFVWRSTLLKAADLQPILSVISAPWFFWSDAQPSLELVQQSQNSRIASGVGAYSENWWQFVLAAQLTYNLIPRALMLLAARWQLGGICLENSGSYATATSDNSLSPDSSAVTRAAIVYALPSAYVLLDWSSAPEHCNRFIAQSFGKPAMQLPLTALTSAEVLAAIDDTACTVVLVKSWEPPLGELEDILNSIHVTQTGFILPMDWDEETVRSANVIHLKEWQRFAITLGDWKILQPGEHS